MALDSNDGWIKVSHRISNPDYSVGWGSDAKWLSLVLMSIENELFKEPGEEFWVWNADLVKRCGFSSDDILLRAKNKLVQNGAITTKRKQHGMPDGSVKTVIYYKINHNAIPWSAYYKPEEEQF